MLVKAIPLPVDVESRGGEWPYAGEPTAVELAAIEAELEPVTDAVDWQRWADDLAVDAGELAAAVAAFGERVPPSAATVRRWQDLSTEALVELVRAGHLDALDPLYRRYADEVRRVAWGRSGRDPEAAEEAVAETWAGVVASVDSWGPRVRTEDEFRRMLFGLLRLKLKAAVYGRWRETPTALAWVFDVRKPIVEPGNGEVSQVQQDLIVKLREGMESLAPNRREVVRLTWQGLSPNEVAAKLGLTATQVYNLRRAAIEQLRQRLSDPADEAAGVTDLAAARKRRESRRAQLLAAVDQIPEGLREVARMRLQGRRNLDVAHALGITDKNANMKWNYARTAFERLGFGQIETRKSAWTATDSQQDTGLGRAA